jgi:predicted nucleic-acid-binding protein
MRGLDTSVLARYVLADDPEQTPVARDLIEGAEDQGHFLHVSVIALCELVWVLRSPPHRLDRSAIAEIVQSLLDTSTFEIQDRDLVRRALEEFRDGSADFPDYLLGWENRKAGCQDTVTFDRKLRRSTGFSWLTS